MVNVFEGWLKGGSINGIGGNNGVGRRSLENDW